MTSSQPRNPPPDRAERPARQPDWNRSTCTVCTARVREDNSPFCDWCKYGYADSIFYHVTSRDSPIPAYDEVFPFTELWYEIRERIAILVREGHLATDPTITPPEAGDNDYDYDDVAEHNMAT